jgi:hypothetical protein
MGRELGNGVMVWSFAGDVDEETIRCEMGVNGM